MPDLLLPDFLPPGFMLPGLLVPGFLLPDFLPPGFMLPGLDFGFYNVASFIAVNTKLRRLIRNFPRNSIFKKFVKLFSADLFVFNLNDFPEVVQHFVVQDFISYTLCIRFSLQAFPCII